MKGRAVKEGHSSPGNYVGGGFPLNQSTVWTERQYHTQRLIVSAARQVAMTVQSLSSQKGNT